MKHAARDGKIDRDRKMYKERVTKTDSRRLMERNTYRDIQTGKGINREINHREQLTAK